jgi:hypothetical protein
MRWGLSGRAICVPTPDGAGGGEVSPHPHNFKAQRQSVRYMPKLEFDYDAKSRTLMSLLIHELGGPETIGGLTLGQRKFLTVTCAAEIMLFGVARMAKADLVIAREGLEALELSKRIAAICTAVRQEQK